MKTSITLMSYEYSLTSHERKEYRYATLTFAFCSHLFSYSRDEYYDDCKKLGESYQNRAKAETSNFYQLKLDI